MVKPYKSTALLNWISSLETMAIKPTVGAVWAGEEAWWAWNPVAPPLLAFKEANIDPGPPPGMPLGFAKEAEIQVNISQVVEHP